MKNPIDFEGTELQVGDEVLFIPYKGGSLKRGKVIGRSPQQVRVEESYIIQGGKYIGQRGTYEWLRPSKHIYKLK